MWTRFTQLRGDILGGITATLVGLPGSMAYGIIVFAPLGTDYVAIGAAAGLIGLVFANLGAGLAGSNPVLITTPDPVSSLMLAAALSIVLDTIVAIETPDAATLATILLFFIVFASGFCQVVLGLLKLGNLAKYIPYPVTAGILNGVAILMFVDQVRPLLGLSSGNSFTDIGGVRHIG